MKSPFTICKPLAIIATAVTLIFAVTACSTPVSSSTTTEPPTVTPPAVPETPTLSGVFAFGKTLNAAGQAIPCFWDGSDTAIALTLDASASSSSVRGAARLGSSVLLAGSTYISGKELPCLWENGSPSILPIDTSTEGSTNAIAVDGADVYVGGCLYDGTYNQPRYWKNKELQAALTLPAGAISGSIKAITAANGLAYAAGNYYITTVTLLFGGKVGDLISLDLPADATDGCVTAIAASGTRVYYAGYYQNASSSTIPCYWNESGTRTDLSIPAGEVGCQTKSAVFIGTDIYIGGYTSSGKSLASSRVSAINNIPCYWKNGETPTVLAVPSEYSSGGKASLAENVNGKLVIVGQVSAAGTSYYCAWVSGTFFKLGPIPSES